MAPRLPALALFVMASLALAACGGEDPTATAAPEPTAATSTDPRPIPTVDPGIARTTVTLSPSEDASIYEDGDNISNGSGNHIFVGNNLRASLTRRALVRFDIAGNIPAGSTITEVQLDTTVNRTRTGGVSVALHRLAASWTEGATVAPNPEGKGAESESGDVSWSARSAGGDLWSSPGGDFDPQHSATTSAGGLNAEVTWLSTEALVADVQGWLDDSDGNFGWILVGEENRGQTTKRFDSREGGSGPQLTIAYVPAG